MFSRFIHVVARASTSFLSTDEYILMCGESEPSRSVWPFISWGTFGWFPLWALMNNTARSIPIHAFTRKYGFYYLGPNYNFKMKNNFYDKMHYIDLGVLSAKWGFQGGSDRKESACNVGDLGSIPGSGRSPGEGNSNSLQYSSGESHGQRSLAGYSPCGLKGSDMTERLTLTSFHSKMQTKRPASMHQAGWPPGEQGHEGRLPPHLFWAQLVQAGAFSSSPHDHHHPRLGSTPTLHASRLLNILAVILLRWDGGGPEQDLGSQRAVTHATGLKSMVLSSLDRNRRHGKACTWLWEGLLGWKPYSFWWELLVSPRYAAPFQVLPPTSAPSVFLPSPGFF